MSDPTPILFTEFAIVLQVGFWQTVVMVKVAEVYVTPFLTTLILKAWVYFAFLL